MISHAIVTDRSGRPDSHCPDTRPAGPRTPAAEQRAREDVRARLMRRFPDIPSETLATATAEAFALFADARVQHYVPVLAFKRAAEQLSRRVATRGEAGGEP
ncbi:three-helix bundle dimerization domain-containing protein [Streptomyces sp. NPDC096132]|uniref:three-helix bundle dimerization domain-containing protein n=1 Tax=Streptomyces sp. NPDC096132 TaxID=3366075 RepID=UPI003821403B